MLDAQAVFERYGVRGIPVTYIIDRDGKVVTRHLGYGPGMEKLLEDEAKKLLATKAPGR